MRHSSSSVRKFPPWLLNLNALACPEVENIFYVGRDYSRFYARWTPSRGCHAGEVRSYPNRRRNRRARSRSGSGILYADHTIARFTAPTARSVIAPARVGRSQSDAARIERKGHVVGKQKAPHDCDVTGLTNPQPSRSLPRFRTIQVVQHRRPTPVHAGRERLEIVDDYVSAEDLGALGQERRCAVRDLAHEQRVESIRIAGVERLSTRERLVGRNQLAHLPIALEQIGPMLDRESDEAGVRPRLAAKRRPKLECLLPLLEPTPTGGPRASTRGRTQIFPSRARVATGASESVTTMSLSIRTTVPEGFKREGYAFMTKGVTSISLEQGRSLRAC